MSSKNEIFDQVKKSPSTLSDKNKISDQGEKYPSILLENPSIELIANLKVLSEVFQQIEKETAEIAEMLFDYLIGVDDEKIMTGTIPPHKKKKINDYIKILNRLFLFSKNYSKNTGIRIISRKVVEELDKKTFTICMCYDGGVSLDILCDIVNTENQARVPGVSPVRVTVKQVFGDKSRSLA